MDVTGDPLEERILRRIPLEILAAAAALAVPAGLLFGLEAGGLFFGGGALAALGFLSLKQSLGRVLAGEKPGRGVRRALLFYLLRLALLLIVFYIIMLIFRNKIIAFAAGFSTVVLVLGAEAARTLARVKEWKR